MDDSHRHDVAEHLAAMARELQAPDTLDATLEAIVKSAVANVPNAQYASVSVIEARTRVRTLASTGDVPRTVDQLQYDVGQGPCLDALFEHRTVKAADLRVEDRWPEFAARAAALGIASMLAVQLFVAGDDLGVLNLFSDEVSAFGAEAEEMALLFATHAAIAMADAQKRENLNIALSSRDVIGQAKGILMERHRLTANEAFQRLVQLSQVTHLKLRDIAEQLTTTGELPRSSR